MLGIFSCNRKIQIKILIFHRFFLDQKDSLKVVTFRKEDIFHTTIEIAVDIILERKVLRDTRLFWIEDLKIKQGTTGVEQILLGRHNRILQGG